MAYHLNKTLKRDTELRAFSLGRTGLSVHFLGGPRIFEIEILLEPNECVKSGHETGELGRRIGPDYLCGGRATPESKKPK